MRYLALACDYDGTLANGGKVSGDTLAALERFSASGRKLIMVTGREVQDLFTVFTRGDLFTRIVAENGALLYNPASGEKRRLADPPPAHFIAMLRQRKVPFSAGETIVSTTDPHQKDVLETIKELELDLKIIFNKGALMILPNGTNKASGLAAALREINLPARSVVAIGDAENDHAFLDMCGCSVAVANALPRLQEEADFVTVGADGAGCVELIEEILATDLSGRKSRETQALSAETGGAAGRSSGDR